MAHNYKNLLIWQKAMDLTDLIFEICQKMPPNERFNLTDQMNRSSCSIPSNIAEGSGKRTERDFARFLSISIGSSFELETQLLICERRKYVDSSSLQSAIALNSEIQKMIFGFREKIVQEKSISLNS